MKDQSATLDLSEQQRKESWDYLVAKLEEYYTDTVNWKVTPRLDKTEVISFIKKFDFNTPVSPQDAIDHIMDGFKNYHVHTPHPHYMGLFNPRASFPSILGDTMAAIVNPQMAAWSHAPFGIEVENYIVRSLGNKFGLGVNADGVFTSGGAEANLTAVCCALSSKYPQIKTSGLRALNKQPRIYTSSESHHSIQKAAVITGLGTEAVVAIDVDASLSMVIEDLKAKIDRDRTAGFDPFLVVGTAGTTGAGGFDDLNAIRHVANTHGLWMHADAAYGGACALTDSYNHLLSGIGKTDSITFDAHKWLSVPMGAGIFITPHKHILSQSFDTVTQYMPKEAIDLNVTDPYSHSIQWSRRFTGLKLYMAMLILGWQGFKKSIEEDFATGIYFKKRLEESGWKIYNRTQLPILCFNKPDKCSDPNWIKTLVDRLIWKGRMWLSVYPVNGIFCARACITNYKTRKKEVDLIVELINEEVKNM